jgi:endonuclease YncB( thermonuclease family)
MRLFYLYNPKSSAPSKLNWSQYSELLPLEDPAILAKLEKRVLEEGLTHKALRQLVRHELVREQVAENLNAVHNTPSAVHSLELLTPPKDLTLRTYKKAALVSQEDAVLDCGFYVYHTAKPEELKTVTVTDKPAYAYPAVVERVVDGDTLVLVIDLGFGTQVREKIRLRGIDCPELGSPEGEAAKRFVMKLLPAGTEVILRSSKSDKYGRFVGDVFPNDREGKQIYLNNHLLENGYAVRLEE